MLEAGCFLYKVVAASYDGNSSILFTRADRKTHEDFVQDMAGAMVEMALIGDKAATTEQEHKDVVYFLTMERVLDADEFVVQMAKKGYTKVTFDVRVELNAFLRPLTTNDDMSHFNGDDDEEIQRVLRAKLPNLCRNFSLDDF